MSTPQPIPSPVTPVTPAPTMAQVAASDVAGTVIGQLLTMQQQLEVEIGYLANAAANLADRQARLAAVNAQLAALGYVAAAPVAG